LCATLRPGMDYILRAEHPAPHPVGSGGRIGGVASLGGNTVPPQGKHGRQGNDTAPPNPKQAKTDA
jgi:hypothetical protein